VSSLKIDVCHGAWAKQSADVFVLGLSEGAPFSKEVAAFDRLLGGKIREVADAGEFTGKFLQLVSLHSTGQIACRRLLLVGMGKPAEWTLDRLRRVAATGARSVRDSGASTLCFPLTPSRLKSDADSAQVVAEGMILGLYKFSTYKTKPDDKSLQTCTLITDDEKQNRPVEEGVSRGQIVAESALYARDLCNSPANVVTPAFLADEAKKIASEEGLKVTVLERADMEQLGMGALLGVAQGAATPPKFIVLEYDGNRSGKGAAGKPVALVGKSVTFDSGGISLKPADDMGRMKYDMTGGATVLATIRAAARLKIAIPLVGILPATDNMPGGAAMHPGDILTTLSGQTVEVVNTDAEGRLCLADALTYALRYKPRAIIDLATLTGACVVALGNHAMAIFGNDSDLIQSLRDAGDETAELAWPLPLWDVYFDPIKSDVADLKNSGGRPAGAITAAIFLKQFVDKTPWVHLDMAGVAWNTDASPYLSKGSTGVGVRLLVAYLSRLAAESSRRPRRQKVAR
jgi:leucyl aminopeptidase